MSTAAKTSLPALTFDDDLIDLLLDRKEDYQFDCKRIKRDLTKLIETVVAFANSDGDMLAIGFEDPDKARGRDRVYGIQENPMNWDELQRQLRSRITEPHLLAWSPVEVGCTLRDGTKGTVIFLQVEKSTRVHSIIRIFHYKGNRRQTDPRTNLLRPPLTISGPIIQQIKDAKDAVLRELASGIQMGPLGFEIVQKYPVRVINEAIANAVIHRDYRLPFDITISIFSDRIEVMSPGLLAGPVTVANIEQIGTFNRNPVLVSHLRQFPDPPNLDAGEGVRMMFGTMRQTGLYPPLYITRPQIIKEAVTVHLFNENRPSAWEQVAAYIDAYGSIGNAEIRQLMDNTDTLKASQQIKKWRDLGLLIVANPYEGKRIRRYTKPNRPPNQPLFLKPH